jgi:hypothetical protein
MSDSEYSRAEVAARGEAIYEQKIRPQVESAAQGKYVVLDIETGQYEVDQDDLAATKRMLAKSPDAVLYGLRVGYPAAYRLGGVTMVSGCSAAFNAT